MFVLAPLVAAVAPVLVVPAVTSSSGASGWAAVAVALAVGGAGQVVAELGWSLDQVQAVARADDDERRRLWDAGLAAKLAAASVVAPVCALVACLVVADHGLAAALVAAGTVVTGAASPSWFFVGAGRPGAALVSDALPRVLLLLVAAAAMTAGADLVVYGVVLLLVPVASVGTAAAVGRLAWLPSWRALREAPQLVRRRAVIVRGRAVSTVYTMLPAAVLGVVSPGAVAAFSGADRPMRMGFAVLGALPARLQNWLGSAPAPDRARRIAIAVALNTAAGAVAAVGFVVAMPVVAPVLLSGAVELPTDLLVAVAGLLLVMSVSRGGALGLVSVGEAPRITTAVTAAAAVGLPALVVGGATGGALGTVLALVLAEAVGCAVQFACLGRVLRRRVRAEGQVPAQVQAQAAAQAGAGAGLGDPSGACPPATVRPRTAP
nr:oligosaccharide flippase family protein [Frigoribacterium faeni]